MLKITFTVLKDLSFPLDQTTDTCLFLDASYFKQKENFY